MPAPAVYLHLVLLLLAVATLTVARPMPVHEVGPHGGVEARADRSTGDILTAAVKNIGEVKARAGDESWHSLLISYLHSGEIDNVIGILNHFAQDDPATLRDILSDDDTRRSLHLYIDNAELMPLFEAADLPHDLPVQEKFRDAINRGRKEEALNILNTIIAQNPREARNMLREGKFQLGVLILDTLADQELGDDTSLEMNFLEGLAAGNKTCVLDEMFGLRLERPLLFAALVSNARLAPIFKLAGVDTQFAAQFDGTPGIDKEIQIPAWKKEFLANYHQHNYIRAMEIVRLLAHASHDDAIEVLSMVKFSDMLFPVLRPQYLDNAFYDPMQKLDYIGVRLLLVAQRRNKRLGVTYESLISSPELSPLLHLAIIDAPQTGDAADMTSWRNELRECDYRNVTGAARLLGMLPRDIAFHALDNIQLIYGFFLYSFAQAGYDVDVAGSVKARLSILAAAIYNGNRNDVGVAMYDLSVYHAPLYHAMVQSPEMEELFAVTGQTCKSFTPGVSIEEHSGQFANLADSGEYKAALEQLMTLIHLAPQLAIIRMRENNRLANIVSGVLEEEHGTDFDLNQYLDLEPFMELNYLGAYNSMEALKEKHPKLYQAIHISPKLEKLCLMAKETPSHDFQYYETDQQFFEPVQPRVNQLEDLQMEMVMCLTTPHDDVVQHAREVHAILQQIQDAYPEEAKEFSSDPEIISLFQRAQAEQESVANEYLGVADDDNGDRITNFQDAVATEQGNVDEKNIENLRAALDVNDLDAYNVAAFKLMEHGVDVPPMSVAQEGTVDPVVTEDSSMAPPAKRRQVHSAAAHYCAETMAVRDDLAEPKQPIRIAMNGDPEQGWIEQKGGFTDPVHLKRDSTLHDEQLQEPAMNQQQHDSAYRPMALNEITEVIQHTISYLGRGSTLEQQVAACLQSVQGDNFNALQKLLTGNVKAYIRMREISLLHAATSAKMANYLVQVHQMPVDLPLKCPPTVRRPEHYNEVCQTPPLYAAIARNNRKLVQALMVNGADAMYKVDEVPIVAAAVISSDTVDLLNDILTMNEKAISTDTYVVLLVVAASVDNVNAAVTIFGAVRRKNIDLASTMSTLGANSPLHLAASVDMVQLLVANGADPLYAPNGIPEDSALMLAITSCKDKLVRAMLPFVGTSCTQEQRDTLLMSAERNCPAVLEAMTALWGAGRAEAKVTGNHGDSDIFTDLN